MTTRAYQGYGNCEIDTRKTKVNNHTQKWRGKADDKERIANNRYLKLIFQYTNE